MEGNRKKERNETKHAATGPWDNMTNRLLKC